MATGNAQGMTLQEKNLVSSVGEIEDVVRGIEDTLDTLLGPLPQADEAVIPKRDNPIEAARVRLDRMVVDLEVIRERIAKDISHPFCGFYSLKKSDGETAERPY